MSYNFISTKVSLGWKVEWNTLPLVDPAVSNRNTIKWIRFKDTMLHLSCSTLKIDLELGWKPEGNPDGKFVLTFVSNSNWASPTFKKSFEDRKSALEFIYQITAYPSQSSNTKDIEEACLENKLKSQNRLSELPFSTGWEIIENSLYDPEQKLERNTQFIHVVHSNYRKEIIAEYSEEGEAKIQALENSIEKVSLKLTVDEINYPEFVSIVANLINDFSKV